MSSQRPSSKNGGSSYTNEGFIGSSDDPVNVGSDGFQTIDLNDSRDEGSQANNGSVIAKKRRFKAAVERDNGNVGYDNSLSTVTLQAGSPVGEPPPAGDETLEKNADDGLCGWWVFKPRSIQKFRTAKWALFWLCWAGGLQGMVVNGFVNVVITTIEKRFGLRSSQTGLVAGAYDVASFVCLIPVTYLGGRVAASKPRWLGWGTVLMGVGSLVFAVPHFAVGPYRAGTDTLTMCLHQTNNSSSQQQSACEMSDHQDGSDGMGVSHYVWVFLAAQLLHGAGASPLFTLGVTYMDENVSKKMSSVYLGIYYTMSVIGPALGYVIGGQFLSIYSDFATVDPSKIGLTQSSNVWIGAWWIGFLLSAVLCFIVAIPILAFPSALPGSEELRKERVSEAHGGVSNQAEAFGKIREMPKAFLTLMRNPTFFCLNLAGASEGLLISGFAAFLPKLIENQFSVNATQAALLMGLVTVPAGGGGTFLGGYLVKKLNLNCSGIIKLCVFATLVGVGFSMCFFISCPNLAFAGVTQAYNPNQNVTEELRANSLESPCNADCFCSRSTYDPVCGSDGVLYYSPCYAGCSAEAVSQDFKLYGQCACIDTSKKSLDVDDIHEFKYLNSESNTSANFNTVFGQMEKVKLLSTNYTTGFNLSGDSSTLHYEAINQMCDSTCSYLWVFVVLTFGIMFFTFLATMPALSATLRCVQDDQRSFALGIQWIKVRLLGTIPAPMIFGALIDETCILWQNSCDDDKGACLVYDNTYMSWYMLALAFAGKMCSLLFFFLAWWFYKPPQSPVEVNSTCLPSVDLKIQNSNNIHTNTPSNGYVNNSLDDQCEHF